MELREESVRKFNASALFETAAAGLRHSRAPFPVERDCAESQSQQHSFARESRSFRKCFMRVGIYRLNVKHSEPAKNSAISRAGDVEAD